MLQVDIDHEMLNSFFGDQRAGYSGLGSAASFEEGFPFDKEDPSLRQMFLADAPSKSKRSARSKKPSGTKSPKRKRQYSSGKPVAKPEWKKPQCLRLMVDITKLEPLSSKERSETASNYSEEDFNELMTMVLEDGASLSNSNTSPSQSKPKQKPKPTQKAKPKMKPKTKPKPKPKRSSTIAAIKPKASSPSKGKGKSAALKPKAKAKGKPKVNLTVKGGDKAVARKKSTSGASKVKTAKALSVVKSEAKSVGVKRKLAKFEEKKKSPKAKAVKLSGLQTVGSSVRKAKRLPPSPDSSATTFDFGIDDYDFSLDLMDSADLANKRRRTKWHDEDTQTLWEGIMRYGNNWSEIKNMLPGRTYYQVKDKGRRLLHHKGWKTGRSKNDACGAGEYAKNIAKSMLSNSASSGRRDLALGTLDADRSLVNMKLPSVAANA